MMTAPTKAINKLKFHSRVNDKTFYYNFIVLFLIMKTIE